VPRRGGVPATLGAPIGVLGARDVAALAQQPAEGERSVRGAALVGTAIGRLGPRGIVALIQQESEPRCRLTVAEPVSLPVQHLGRPHILALLQLQRDLELGSSIRPRGGSLHAGDDVGQARHWG
jgi:hypothetical protein